MVSGLGWSEVDGACSFSHGAKQETGMSVSRARLLPLRPTPCGLGPLARPSVSEIICSPKTSPPAEEQGFEHRNP